MLFNSMSFAIFLPIVFVLFWIIPNRFRWILLLIASYYFYMSWNVKYVFLIVITTLISYGTALILERASSKKIKKLCIVAALVVSLGILFVFKYFNFFMDSVAAVASTFAIPIHPVTLSLMLPVGISFYTFQTLSYVVDVYRGNVAAEHHLGKYATFISFFPQLVAGPIERTSNLLPQISKVHTFKYDNAAYGLKLMAWGFFKKIVIADSLAAYVDTVYDSLSVYTGFPMVIAAVFFSFQIYCDFSGYSDIAIGTAKLFDIELMRNFDSPYFSTSIKEFWSRWHISLSTWFRDYVYIPLGGNRCGKMRQRFNLMATFTISGLWHGANWTYVIWGLIHGAGQVVENMLSKNKRKTKLIGSKPAVKAWLSVLFIFTFSCVAWVFFRASDLQSVGYIFSHAFDGITKPSSYIMQGLIALNLGKEEILGILLMLVILLIYDYISLKTDVITRISNMKLIPRWCIYIVFILLLLCLMPVNSGGEFIYFQF
ncbi:MAG: MBOAT family protein [Clostridia bacterium]|nr:MBOAT family protein [Clostridia bacterium]